MPRYPRGLTRSAKGWRITVKRKGRPTFQKRFPPATPQETVERALLQARSRMRVTRGILRSGTFASDVAQYLTDHFTGHPGYAERARHLDLWLDALGRDQWRGSITRDDIARVLNQWRASGLAADTCNKRRTALVAFFHALDGRGAPNPAREVPKYRVPAPLPRGLAYVDIERALRQLPICKTRARLALMAYTGLRHGQIMALTPESWNRRQHVLLVPGTAKGRGTKPYVLPLSPVATAALQAFDRLEAWGRFTWAPMARMWKVAAHAAKLPPGTVPYDLRHSFGTELYRQTGDLKATKELMGHSSITMTERYMLAAVPARQKWALTTAFKGRTLPKAVAT